MKKRRGGATLRPYYKFDTRNPSTELRPSSKQMK